MKKYLKNDRGFTLLIAIVITATLLLVSSGIISLVVKQAFLASAAEQSQAAFYAADSGVECALYWDKHNPSGQSAFTDGAATTISCNQDSSNPTNPTPNTPGHDTSFTITFNPKSYCAIVIVKKPGDGTTSIESRGYNTCNDADPRRVERGVKVSY